MVVAGRVLPDGDVAIMMVEAEATEKTIELSPVAPPPRPRRSWPRASRPPSPSSRRCATRRPRWPRRPRSRSPSSPASSTTRTTSTPPSRRRSATSSPQAQQIAGKHEREDATDALKDEVKAALSGQFEGREKEISGAFRALTKKVVRQRILRDKVRIDGRGLTDIRPLSAEVEVVPARARLGAVRARRDPDPGRHHAEHAPHGAAAGHAVAGDAQALHAQLQLPAVLHG